MALFERGCSLGRRASKTTPSKPSQPVRTVSRVGTSIQRSDLQNRRKAIFLVTPPPPIPRGRKRQSPGDVGIVSYTPSQERRATRPTAVPTTARVKPTSAVKIRPWSGLPVIVTRPTTAVAAPPASAAAASRPPPAAASRPPPAAVSRPPPTAAAPPPPPAKGPANSPPIMVEYAPREFAAVPYYSVTVSRSYKLRTDDGRRYKLLFLREGRLLASRLLPPQASGSPKRGVM